MLILLKKDEFERNLLDIPRERIKTADARWKNVTAGLLKYGFNRKQTLIRKKWEKLMTDFKKKLITREGLPLASFAILRWGLKIRNVLTSRHNMIARFTNEWNVGYLVEELSNPAPIS